VAQKPALGISGSDYNAYMIPRYHHRHTLEDHLFLLENEAFYSAAEFASGDFLFGQ
jgi:hypothetical protein